MVKLKKATKPRGKGSHKGQKCNRGEPIFYDELKKPVNFTLTPTAVEKLNKLAIDAGLSRSEYLERWLRAS